MRRALSIILVLVMALIFAGSVAAQDSTTHVVQPGENLYRISLRYGVSMDALAQANGIVNKNLIFVGQRLTIPGAGSGNQDGDTPGDGGSQPSTGTYRIVAGDNLFRIASRFSTTLSQILALNPNITNANLIFVGQVINVPGGGGSTTPPPTPPPTDNSGTGSNTGNNGGTTPPPSTAPNVPFAFGLQVHLPNQDMASVVARVNELGVSWVKQQIEWKTYEIQQGSINFAPIDEMVNALEAAGVNILFSVVKAPDWARGTTTEDGPPADFDTFAAFVRALADRYRGRVDAYEIWNEQNLRREWNSPSHPISPAGYVELLRRAYAAIKAVDPAAIVVAGGLAPTGFNDGVNAIDDRVFFQGMYANGVAQYSDAIGAHPNGWANPPDSLCCNNTPGVETHDDHASFFFLETLRDYRAIMVAAGDSNTFIWATEFGWGSNADTGSAPPAGYEFVAFSDLAEQAAYYVRGFELGRSLNYVGPMFLWNLNFCEAAGANSEQCLWSLYGPAGPRPVYAAVRDMPK